MEPAVDRSKQFECLLEPNWSRLFPPGNLLRSTAVQLDRKFYDYLLEDGTFIHPKYTKDYDSKTDEYVDVGDAEPEQPMK